MNTRRRNRRRRLLAQSLEDRCLLAGPYAPAAGQIGSEALAMDDPAIVGWAHSVTQYSPGSDVDATQSLQRALGPAQGTSGDVVTLGRGGSITLSFQQPIRDGLGFDFAVFENSFSDDFLELAYVEVSSDGQHFVRFESDSLTSQSVASFGSVDPTDVDNLAGKYRARFGTPFDLEELLGVDPRLDVTSVTHVRIIDVIGDGRDVDGQGDPIYDPFPTVQTAGFDLDAVAVLRQADSIVETAGFEDVGASLAAESAFSGPVAGGTVVTGPFGDTVVKGEFTTESLKLNNAYSQDYGSWTQWAYSNHTDTTTAGFSNQFSSFAGGGVDGSPTFGVGFDSSGEFYAPPTITRDADDHRQLDSIWLTNTTYTALSMRDGDAFAKKFGGESGNDEDYFKLVITGKDEAGNSIGTVDFYLADYRFADNLLDYIVDQWVQVDLSSIAEARSLEFDLSSSDVGPFGMNTPAFFAADHLTFTQSVLALDVADRSVLESAGPNATTVRISRVNDDTALPFTVDIAPVDATIATLPTSVTIPAGERYIEFPVQLVDNAFFHGERSIEITASADGLISVSETLTIQDDEKRSLTLQRASQSLAESGSVTATLSRNDADVVGPLTVELDRSDSSLISVPTTVTIPAGQREVTFAVQGVDDDVSRSDSVQTVTASSPGYVAAQSTFTVTDNDPARLTITIDSAAYSEADANPAAGMEDVGRRLTSERFYNGADLAGGFDSQGLRFSNNYNADFASWSGWAYSNTTDVTTPGFGNQYSAYAGGGAFGSPTYGVAAAYGATTIARDPGSTVGFESIEISNSTYAALSMLHGDAFAKKFGGESGDDPDFFLLTIEGRDESGTSVGTVDFYLADYRFTDSSQDYIVDTWTTVDLSAISEAVELSFSLSSSDNGQWGMNTPASFVADNVTLKREVPAPTITVARNTADVSGPLAVQLDSSDTTELMLPATAIIPAGASQVQVPVRIVDDALVDGTQSVTVHTMASGLLSGSASVQILDDEDRELTLTLSNTVLNEAGGEGRGVVHRNVEDLSQDQRVQLTAGDDLQLPAEVVIPAGQASVAFTYAAVDNEVVDADRTVRVTAAASSYADGSAEVSIQNDDVPPPSLVLTIDRTNLGESEAAATATVTRRDSDLREPLVVTISHDDETEIDTAATVTIPAGQASVSFPVHPVDDVVHDGTRQVVISVQAQSHVADSIDVAVTDDEVATLTATLAESVVTEGDVASTTLTVHRNSEDLSQALPLQFDSLPAGISIDHAVEIPAGQSTVSVEMQIADNDVRDGDRSHDIGTTADGFVSGTTSLQINDDEVSAIVVTLTDAGTTVAEYGGSDRFGVSLASRPLATVVINIQTTSDDVSLSTSQLAIEPDQWDAIQWVDVHGVADLAIDPETVQLTVAVDAGASTPLYATAGDQHVDVTVQDHQPTRLQIDADANSVFLVDLDSGQRITEAALAGDLHVVASSAAQHIRLQALTAVAGTIHLDAGAGDDIVELRGNRFTSLSGGEGFDTLVIEWHDDVDLVSLLNSGVSGFESVVVNSPAASQISIDADRLASVLDISDHVTIRLADGQQLRVNGTAVVESPSMVESEFAQVISVDSRRVYVVTPRPWQNSLNRWDVNHSGQVTSLDALAVVNQLGQSGQSELPELTDPVDFPGMYFDVTGEGQLTALDALQVINQIARQQLQGESEAVAVGSVAQSGSANHVNRIRDDLRAPIVAERTSASGKILGFDQAIRELAQPADSVRAAEPQADTLGVIAEDRVQLLAAASNETP